MAERVDNLAPKHIETAVEVGVADIRHHLPDQRFQAQFAARANLAGYHDERVLNQNFAGNPGIGVLGQQGIQHGIGNLVRDFVGMAFGDGLGGKDMVVGHWAFACSVQGGPFYRNQPPTPPPSFASRQRAGWPGMSFRAVKAYSGPPPHASAVGLVRGKTCAVTPLGGS